MAFLTSGGSTATSATIVDNEIVNADINSAAAIAQSKIAGTDNTDTSLVVIEETSGTTHSLTTVANQRVFVIAKGYLTGSAGNLTINLKYNGVAEDTTVSRSDGTAAFCLCAMIQPGAATADITVDAPGGGVVNLCRIIAIKFKATA